MNILLMYVLSSLFVYVFNVFFLISPLIAAAATEAFTTQYPEYDNTSFQSIAADIPERSVAQLAQDYIIYHIGVSLQVYFLPAIIPIGIAGNILSFLVMSSVSCVFS